jgi:thiamine pyrophosphokinase
MKVAIITNGQMQYHSRLETLWRAADWRIAANGGAVNARRHFARAPEVLIGDLDSLDADTRAWCAAHRVEMIQHPREKDQTDLELALDLALTRGATEITLLGALGGRFDQMLANVFLLVKAAQARVLARIAEIDFDAWVVWEHLAIAGRIGEIVSLIPLTERVEGIATRGLRYPLRNETLYLAAARGVSNELIAERAEVTLTRGVLLIVHLTRA